MNDTPENKDRRIIPRWRNSKVTRISIETQSLFPRKVKLNGLPIILEKKGDWDRNKDIVSAVELVTSSFSQNLTTYSIEAAEFLIGKKTELFPEVYSIAEKTLSQKSNDQNYKFANKLDAKIKREDIFAQIHYLKQYLSKYPNDALTWVDLSQNYIRLNQVEQAKQSINSALFISPNNRFILRSATRLFIHLREPDRANKLLLSKTITRIDPWLLSAEIATATIERKTSTLIKIGREIIDNKKFSHIHLSELASAIGTVDCLSGSIKKAKQLFQISLLDPTENAVAQSSWAKRIISSIDNTIALKKTPNIFEALVFKSYYELNWDLLIESAKNWLSDEPFSSRPAEMGSFAAADGTNNFQLAKDFCESGLIANPSDPTLLNNLAFSLINLGQLEKGKRILESTKNLQNIGPTEVALKATEGLWLFRTGNFDLGNQRYLEAMEIAEKKFSVDLMNRVSIYYVQEMLSNGLLTVAEALYFAESKKNSLSNPVTLWLFERFIKNNSKS